MMMKNAEHFSSRKHNQRNSFSEGNRTKCRNIGSLKAPGGTGPRNPLCSAFTGHSSSEKPRSGLLTLEFSPPRQGHKQSILLLIPAACHKDRSLRWVCCVPLYQRNPQVGFPPQRSTVDLLDCAATSAAVSPLQLNHNRTLGLFAHGAMSRAELYDHTVKILPGSSDASL